jgi:hypothetical protein
LVRGHRRPAPIPVAYPRPKRTAQSLTGRSPRLPDGAFAEGVQDCNRSLNTGLRRRG